MLDDLADLIVGALPELLVDAYRVAGVVSPPKAHERIHPRELRWGGRIDLQGQPVKARICVFISGKAAINSSMLPCSTSGGSTPGHSVLASSA